MMNVNLRTVLLLVGVSLLVSSTNASVHTDVTAEQARDLIDSTDDLIIIDVREPSEYSDTRGHIPGALNFSLYSAVLMTRYEELPMNSPILVVCASGSRSNQSASYLDLMGFSMVYDMLGGMSAWMWETVSSADSDNKYGSGTGEPNNPYLIYTAGQLNAIGAESNDLDKNFRLIADIDLSGYSYDRAVIAWDTNDAEPDFQGTSFTGVFAGNNHTISHLTIAGDSILGLFGSLESGAIISNLCLKAVDVDGTGGYVGGLVGKNHSGSITNCSSAGTVAGEDHVGGLVGYNYFGSVSDCYSTNMVIGNKNVGGLAGFSLGSITASYSNSTVDGQDMAGGLVGENIGFIIQSYSSGNTCGFSSVGGLVGCNYFSEATDTIYPPRPGIVTQCYSTVRVTGEQIDGVGGLVGKGDWGYVTESFWDIETSNQAVSNGGTGKTTAEMQTASTFLDAGWDFDHETENGAEDIWSICDSTNYPRLVWEIPTGDFVCPEGVTIDDLLFLMEHLLESDCYPDNDYCQGTDLDQSGTVDENDLIIFFENWPAGK